MPSSLWCVHVEKFHVWHHSEASPPEEQISLNCTHVQMSEALVGKHNSDMHRCHPQLTWGGRGASASQSMGWAGNSEVSPRLQSELAESAVKSPASCIGIKDEWPPLTAASPAPLRKRKKRGKGNTSRLPPYPMQQMLPCPIRKMKMGPVGYFKHYIWVLLAKQWAGGPIGFSHLFADRPCSCFPIFVILLNLCKDSLHNSKQQLNHIHGSTVVCWIQVVSEILVQVNVLIVDFSSVIVWFWCCSACTLWL